MNNKTTRNLTILLVFSVAVNLLLIGGFVGNKLRGHHPDRPMPTHMRWIVRTLDEGSREEIIPIMKSFAKQSRPLQRELRRSQQAYEEAMSNDKFDAEQVTRAITNLQQSTQALQTNMHKQMFAIMKKLSPEQRLKTMEFLKQHRQRNRKSPRRDRSLPHPAPHATLHEDPHKEKGR